MDASQWYLLASVIGAAFTASAWFGFRNVGQVLPVYFMMSWLTGELALFHIGWQMLATLLFVAFGGLEGGAGLLGLAISFVSWAGLLALQRRAEAAGPAFARGLVAALGDDFEQVIPEERRALLQERVSPRDWLLPFRFPKQGLRIERGLAYGPAGKRQTLDVYRPAAPVENAPVLLQVHGGAWTIGEKEQQGQPLMRHLAQRGWVCVAINYQLSPRVKFPEHLVDVKRAIAWIREHVAEYGGDPSWLAVTGGSARGHLTALTALTPNDPRFQPGFEQVDTSVDAAVPFYGIYDFVDRAGVRTRSSMRGFLERYVMPAGLDEDRELWDMASPITHVREDAPPFFVIHGNYDALAFVEDARLFVTALRGVSRNPVAYVEVPWAQHAFEIFNSERSAQATLAVTRFLEWARARAGAEGERLPEREG